VLGNTLNRMIFWELVRVFLLSLGTLTGLFLVVFVVQQASLLGLSLNQIVRVVPLLVPSMLPITIPATTLFASCVVYGRLSHDNEVVALKAAGVHLYTLVRPALLLGVIATGATASLYHTTIPATQREFYEAVLADPEEVLYNQLRRDRCLRHPSLPYVLYVRDVEGKRLVDVVVKRRKKIKDAATGAEVSFGYDYVARMPEARLRVDVDGGKLSIDPDRYVVHERALEGASNSAAPIVMDLPDSVSGKEARLRISALTYPELPDRIAAVTAERDAFAQRRAEIRAEGERSTNPQVRAAAQTEARGLQYQYDMKARQARNLRAEIHARPALAASCLVFALLGCPVGIWANRSDYLSTFVICFLPALVVYYPLLLAGSDLGKSGRVPMGLGCWLADIVLAHIAVFLIWRFLRR
jgi:lipopolysaccharide export system permease protein